MIKNKKAQDLSVTFLILIVVGIILLVLIVVGFTGGWKNIWDKFNIFGGGGSSVGDIVTACNLPTISLNSYCYEFNKAKINEKTEYLSCEDSRVISQVTDRKTCDSTASSDAKIAKCRSLGKNETLVNGNTCGNILLAAGSAKRCQGNSLDCSSFKDNTDNNCNDQTGCTWNEQTKKCDGSVNACPSITDEQGCDRQQGCDWK